MIIKENRNWSSSVALIGSIKLSISQKKFDGHHGAIAQVHRLSPQFLTGTVDPDLVIKKMHMRVYNSASRYFCSKIITNPLWCVYYPRSLWYKHKARELSKKISKQIRLPNVCEGGKG